MSVVIKAEKLYPLITLRYKQNKYGYEAPINLHHEKIPTDATSKLWEKKKTERKSFADSYFHILCRTAQMTKRLSVIEQVHNEQVGLQPE